MIYESHPWKQDLLRRKCLIQKYNRAEYLSEDAEDRAYSVIEKAIFYSAFIIRKLIDCKGKVSNEVDGYQFSLKGVKPKRRIDYMHRWPDEDTHDWEHESTYTKNGKEICKLVDSFLRFLSELQQSWREGRLLDFLRQRQKQNSLSCGTE